MSRDLNFVSLLGAGLEEAVREAVTEKAVSKHLKEYEVQLREMIRPLVESICFKGIDRMKDHMRLRDELHVYLHWDGEDDN